MKKRKSTRETPNMIQTALWLPRDVHGWLKKEGGERGLGEEIRRLISHYWDAAQNPGDQVTNEVLYQIKDLARDLSDWHADRFVFDVLKSAINVLLSVHQPSNGKPDTKARLQALYGEQTPEAIGRIIAHVAIKAHARNRRAMYEKTYAPERALIAEETAKFVAGVKKGLKG